MDIISLETENINLKNKIKELEQKLKIAEEKNKKYTNSEAHKEYYQAHKEEVKAKGNAYLKKLKVEDPEKLKKYRHTAYVNRKKKNENLINIEIN